MTPTGGPKDTIPPVIVYMNPDNFSPIAALNFLYELKKRATANDD